MDTKNYYQSEEAVEADEGDGLLKEKHHTTTSTLQKSKRAPIYSQRLWILSFGTVLVFIIIFIVAISGVGGEIKSIISDYFSSGNVVDESSYTLTLNLESPTYGALSSASILDWDYIAEPYKPMTYSIESLLSEESEILDLGDLSVTWTINGDEYSGSTVSVTINEAGGSLKSCSVKVVYYNSNGEKKIYNKSFDVALKYVRREIRSMSDDELSTWLDAMKIYYTTSTSEGQEKYGSKYFSAEESLHYHLNGAARTDCDHWHDGAGIVVKHMSFTLAVEQSLQAIDPSITMPYWEYAQDEYLYDYWFESTIFDDDVLGTASPTTSDHSLTTGIWANIEAPDGSDYTDFDVASEGTLNPYINAYGYLRAPWNNNPTPIISRYNYTYDKLASDVLPYPACHTMFSCYNVTTLASMHDCLNGNTHGPVHIYIGGTWGQTSDLWDDDDITFLQGIDKLLYFKMLWRMGYTRCPDSCDEDKDSDAGICLCAVPDEYVDTYGAKYLLEEAGIYDLIKTNIGKDSDGTIALKVLRALEDPGIVGEMFSSGASYDPTFWPLHGQIERMVGLKRLKVDLGEAGSFDETWGYDTNNYKYLRGICDWSNVTDVNDLTLPSCTMGADVICDGHNEDDVLEFTNFLNQDETYTNREFYTFIHPNNIDLPYVYDDYEFDYCAEYDSYYF